MAEEGTKYAPKTVKDVDAQEFVVQYAKHLKGKVREERRREERREEEKETRPLFSFVFCFHSHFIPTPLFRFVCSLIFFLFLSTPGHLN